LLVVVCLLFRAEKVTSKAKQTYFAAKNSQIEVQKKI